MAKFLRTFILFTVIFLNLAVSGVFAMTPATTAGPTDKARAVDYASGLFGGIRKDGTFVLLFSETKGVRFYRTVPGIRATGSGGPYDLTALPINTPITIHTRDGRITAVELQGVMR